MWLIFARAPPPDVRVWPGRRALALLDALAWPAAWAWIVSNVPLSGGLAGRCVLAVCVVSALLRAYRAAAVNHRYRFTTWRWGRWFALVLVFGYVLKFAMVLSA